MAEQGSTDQLLIFGYACKLYRDDERALEHDENKHLIPWMDSESLLIDRYDVRGALYDLKPFEAGSFPERPPSPMESEIEHERWRALTNVEAEELMYKEEEFKRAEPYAQVSFSYNSEPASTAEEKPVTEGLEEDDNEPFVMPKGLAVPPNFVLPPTQKLHSIIERTAKFIALQGPQMEIVLKMRQSKNPQFQFLDFNNMLNPYYRHLLATIRSGEYKPVDKTVKEESESDSEDDSGYLHPSLCAPVNPTPLYIPQLRPSTDTAYSKLVNLIKDKQRQNQPEEVVITPEQQVIIDKMAAHAAKNGREFELVVKQSNDPRFAFLNSDHSHHPYYKEKLKQLLAQAEIEKLQPTVEEIPPVEEKIEVKPEVNNVPVKKVVKSKPKPGPVSFHIKAKEEVSLGQKSALPIEESSDENEENTDEKPAEKTEKVEKPVAEVFPIVKEKIPETLKVVEQALTVNVEKEIPVEIKPHVMEAALYSPESATSDNIPISEEPLVVQEPTITSTLDASLSSKTEETSTAETIKLERKRRLALFLERVGQNKQTSEPQKAPKSPESEGEIHSIPSSPTSEGEIKDVISVSDSDSSPVAKRSKSSRSSERHRHSKKSSKSSHRSSKHSKKSSHRRHHSSSERKHKKHSKVRRHKKRHRTPDTDSESD